MPSKTGQSYLLLKAFLFQCVWGRSLLLQRFLLHLHHHAHHWVRRHCARQSQINDRSNLMNYFFHFSYKITFQILSEVRTCLLQSCLYKAGYISKSNKTADFVQIYNLHISKSDPDSKIRIKRDMQENPYIRQNRLDKKLKLIIRVQPLTSNTNTCYKHLCLFFTPL